MSLKEKWERLQKENPELAERFLREVQADSRSLHTREYVDLLQSRMLDCLIKTRQIGGAVDGAFNPMLLPSVESEVMLNLLFATSLQGIKSKSLAHEIGEKLFEVFHGWIDRDPEGEFSKP
jgi:hypothetical protein